MVSIVLASHGDLAAGIKQTGSMVFGDQPSVAVVSLEPSMGPDDFRVQPDQRAHRGPRFLGYRHRCQPAYAHRGIFAAL